MALLRAIQRMKIELNKLLAYRSERVTSRFLQDYPNSHLTPGAALTELMKYMWLCLKHYEDQTNYPENKSLHFACTMHPEMKAIDDMWHTFLLFTQDYQEFCRDYLAGNFFHHVPLSTTEKKISKARYKLELSRYLSYIHDHLGEETLIQWFKE
jgi:hypothetical protein